LHIPAGATPGSVNITSTLYDGTGLPLGCAYIAETVA